MSRKHVQPLPLRKTAAGIGTVGVIRHFGGKVFVTVEIFFGAYKIRLCAVQKLADLRGALPCGGEDRALKIPYHRNAGHVIGKH